MSKRLWAALVAVALLLAALPVGTSFALTTRVTRCKLRLRAKATTDSDTLAQIPGGTEIAVLGTSGGWTQTTYEGHTGYVSSEHLMETTRSGYFPLKPGDESQYVTELQQRLIQLGYLPTGSATGKYENDTTLAVTKFQKANNISQDGIAGGETQRILYGDSAQGVVTSTDTSNNNLILAPSATASTGTTATPSKNTLRMGDRGDEVRTLQARLIELGYLSGSADGIFGAVTHKAVVDFQKRSSLTADGKAGIATQSVLYSSGATTSTGQVSGSTANTNNTSNSTVTPPTSYKTLKRGMTSNDVKTLQLKLKELGYLTASATGYYGTQTFAAVKNFQESNNLLADGVAGTATQTKLYAGDAQKSGTSGNNTVVDPSTQYATLKEGMKSPAVTTMQKKLKELGYLSASATGYFGSQTKAAVLAFQKNNGLTSDGVAGSATLYVLYDGSPVSAGSSGGSTSVPTSNGNGKISGPSSSSVQLLHWFNQVKPSLKNGSTLLVFDPSTGYAWNLRAMSLGRHCDAEPVTAEDTYFMNQAFGNKTTWNPKVVYIKLPSGTWTMATTHNTPHLSGSNTSNGFDGHLCVHFLRDMDETSKNDPNYGVQNQKAIRDAWLRLKGETITK